MKKILFILMVIIVSLFFFSFRLTVLPGFNTKMTLAGLGIFIFSLNCITQRKVVFTNELFVASLIAMMFSFICFYSVTTNGTNDLFYSSYIVSMWVWLGGAYTVCYIMYRIHGYISVKLVMKYLIILCVLQCVIALLIDNFAFMRYFVDTYIYGEDSMSEENRLYGIGAYLDIAGTRFSAVLTMIVILLSYDEEIRRNKKYIMLYIIMFVFITVVGSMISRTTGVGAIVAFVYLIYATGVLSTTFKFTNLRLWSILIALTFLLVMICIYLYKNVPAAQGLFRFGFEGFINWLETGVWRTRSTDYLQNMWIFPTSLKTWIIGDGLLLNPSNPYKFYMGTDIGYLRFIFYCGLIGLSVFAIFFIYIAVAGYKRFTEDKHLFVILLILQAIIWVKVATDIFLVFALFMCIPMVQIHGRNTNKNFRKHQINNGIG